jgi:hypothetical protein
MQSCTVLYSLYNFMVVSSFSKHRGVTKRCRLSLMTNSALVYKPKCGVEGGVAGVLAKEYGCPHGAQINFGDLTPYLTYVLTASIAVCLF